MVLLTLPKHDAMLRQMTGRALVNTLAWVLAIVLVTVVVVAVFVVFGIPLLVSIFNPGGGPAS